MKSLKRALKAKGVTRPILPEIMCKVTQALSDVNDGKFENFVHSTEDMIYIINIKQTCTRLKKRSI